MERSRRQPLVSAAKANKLSALEQLKAAREGGAKRVADYEVKQESAIYDTVDEQAYAELAAKRRAEGGAFKHLARLSGMISDSQEFLFPHQAILLLMMTGKVGAIRTWVRMITGTGEMMKTEMRRMA